MSVNIMIFWQVLLLILQVPISIQNLWFSSINWSVRNCVLEVNVQCDKDDKILYYMISGKTHEPFQINLTNPDLPDWYNSSWPLKVIIHGYAGRVLTDSTADITKAYKTKDEHNVLVVDWGRLAAIPCYPTATLNTWQVGRCIGELLHTLATVHPPEDVHLLGFSLGAHIAAYASNHVRTYTGRSIGRITGLDPALPFFATLKDDMKLDETDATFVDIIHTNVGLFGKMEPTGHVDFYVNDGTLQPGCSEHRNPPLCSHMLAPTYFAESINSQLGFWGTSCPSYVQYAFGWCPFISESSQFKNQRLQMGEFIIPGARGVYIVRTADRAPFALG